MEVSPLYKKCIWSIAQFLKCSWYQAGLNFLSNEQGNPFCYIPSHIIQDLISSVLLINKSECLKVSDMYFLLSSKQVEVLKLVDVQVQCDDLIAILMTLTSACQKLRSLTLSEVFIVDHFAHLHNDKDHMKKSALECLISISPKLEYLESCIDFDLKSIQNCEGLKVLKLNFVPQVKLYDFLEEIDGSDKHFQPNNSLEVFEVFEDLRHPTPHEDFIPILKYCHALRQTNVDLSKVLEILHSEEMYKGTLATQYKLESCRLGNSLIPLGATTLRAIHIATFTCPDINELSVLVDDNEIICALRDFKKLSSLFIQWDSAYSGYFPIGVGILLVDIGSNLKYLNLVNFAEVDFAVIGINCPNIEILKVDFHSESVVKTPVLNTLCFQHLTSLTIESIESMYNCSERALLMLLSNCKELASLHLDSSKELTDEVLQSVLRQNSLSQLKECVLLNCRLTYEGVYNMVTHMKSLEFLHFNSQFTDVIDVANLIHDINPFVIIRSEDFE